MGKVSKRLNTEHIKAMEKAPTFIGEKTTSTVLVKTRKGTEVYRALRINRADFWLITHAKDLFSKEG